MFLLSGERLIREFLKKPHLKIIHELLAPGAASLTNAPSLEFSGELFNQIDVLGTHFNILVLEQPLVSILDLAGYAPQGIEVVIPVGDPGNLGALLRSCEAFGIRRVILTQEAAHPFLPKAVKASAGSALRLEIRRGPALAAFPEGCIALDSNGTSLYNYTWPSHGLLVVGEEGAGLPATFGQRIRIPTQGVESLNAVVAASIALAHRARLA